MEIKAGDYVREKGTGRLHRVAVAGGHGLHTVRVFDGRHDLLQAKDVEKIVNVSMWPGHPETTRRSVI